MDRDRSRTWDTSWLLHKMVSHLRLHAIVMYLLPSAQEVVTHFLYIKLLYKMGHYFLDIQYVSKYDYAFDLFKAFVFI